MEKLTKLHLRKFLGHGHDPAFSVDELQGLMLQVSFAIMMVFMIAYFMFRTQSTREQDEQLIELQKQKLIAAVEKVQMAYGIRYGLNTLLTVSDDGSVDYDARAYVEDGRLTSAPHLRHAFASGAASAHADYGEPLNLRRMWWEQVLAEAVVDERALQHENRVWLGGRIDAGISGLRRDVERVQQVSAALLQRHWIRHPERIRDPGVAELLSAFHAADEPTRLLLTTELAHALRRYALHYLSAEAGVALLAN